MSSVLEDCPREIIEVIVTLLVLKDICSLRQCSRTLTAKITQGYRFKSYFRLKHVDITGKALQALVDQTQSAGLGCLIQDLVLVGIVNNTKMLQAALESGEEYDEIELEQAQRSLVILGRRQASYRRLHESGTVVDLLIKAFSNLMSNSKTGKLLSLSLKVVVFRDDAVTRLPPLVGGSWRLIWQSAVDTFDIALCSLAGSGLPVEKLSIFNDRQLQRCSLSSDRLGSVDFEHKGLANSLASLKSLSISFSNRPIFRSTKDAQRSDDPAEETDSAVSEEERDIDDVKAEAADERNFNGLTELLKLGSQLEELELHQYLLDNVGLTHADLHYERILQCAAEMNTPPNLKRMELRGLYVREKDLLAFIRRTCVRKLAMYNVVMSSGTFKSVFDYCTSNLADMEELYFYQLYEQGLEVYFDEPAHSESTPLADTSTGGSDKLQRVSDEVKQQISYRSTQLFLPASPATMEVRRQRWREYGPPLRGVA